MSNGDIILFNEKGQAINGPEYDQTLVELRDRPDGQIYSGYEGAGIQLGYGSPTDPYDDLIGEIYYEEGAPDCPSWEAYRGNIKGRKWAVNDVCQLNYHFTHRYVPGTDIYAHIHWSHNSQFITTGDVTFQLEIMYAKSHNQGAYSAPILINIPDSASLTRYQVKTPEVKISAPGGLGGLLNSDDFEADGIFKARVILLSNSMDDNAAPFVDFIDLHVQQNAFGTPNRLPPFFNARP